MFVLLNKPETPTAKKPIASKQYLFAIFYVPQSYLGNKTSKPFYIMMMLSVDEEDMKEVAAYSIN